jgi:hypothetical protein
MRTTCIACSGKLVLNERLTMLARGIVYVCSECGGIHGDFASRAEACRVVDFSKFSAESNDCYFDFDYYHFGKHERVHGFFCRTNMTMTQSG